MSTEPEGAGTTFGYVVPAPDVRAYVVVAPDGIPPGITIDDAIEQGLVEPVETPWERFAAEVERITVDGEQRNAMTGHQPNRRSIKPTELRAALDRLSKDHGGVAIRRV